MTSHLLLPTRRLPASERPERVALNMAFGAGNPVVLGDKSRYRSHGAITTAGVAAGVHGSCLNFVAANPDYVTIPAAHTQLDFTTEDFSIIMRLNPDSVALRTRIFMRSLGWNTNGYEWRIEAGGALRLYTFQAAANQGTLANAVIVAGNWYTVGLSRAGAAVALYVNGVDQTAAPGAHINPLSSAQNAYIGIYDDLLTTPFDGRIEFCRVFRGRELIGSEHLAWHNALA